MWPSRQPQVRITELMYNPPGGSDYEFIELKNVGAGPVDLSNATFRGISFTFPANAAPLPPDELLVLARNANAFAQRYPDVPVNGEYQGNLSNGGEAISLLDSEGNLIEAVTFKDEGGWPISPDGRGDSLILVDFTGNPDAPQSWRASSEVHGSPGRDE